MEALGILRVFFGLLTVLFIPGYALTLALWPKTRGEVFQDVVRVLENKNVSSAFVLGEEDDGLLKILRENSISLRNDIEKADAIILTSVLEGDLHIPDQKTVIDLANNPVVAIKIEDTIDLIERIALGFGLSIALMPLIGLLLDKTKYGIRHPNVLISLFLVTALFYGIYFWRKKNKQSIPMGT